MSVCLYGLMNSRLDSSRCDVGGGMGIGRYENAHVMQVLAYACLCSITHVNTAHSVSLGNNSAYQMKKWNNGSTRYRCEHTHVHSSPSTTPSATPHPTRPPSHTSNPYTQLAVLLPPLQNKLSVIKPALLARLCANPDAIATALLHLKTVFPTANVATMALRCPGLVLGDVSPRVVEQAATQLRNMLPDVQVCVV